MIAQLDELYAQSLAAMAAVGETAVLDDWYKNTLGRKGSIYLLTRQVGQLPAAERPAFGQRINAIKQALEEAYEARLAELKARELQAQIAASAFDVTLPGRRQWQGRLHPATQTLREIYRIWGDMGFQVYRSRDVETDEYNFELLNIPPHHPARDMWDTFHTLTPGVILRTHTSPGQIHAMRQYAPEPIRVILPGKCFRKEDVTARSEMMFYQVEGLAIGHNITFSDLKGTLLNFANQMYGAGRKIRFRKSYFPFTEPSVEVDVDCILCGGEGCRICKHTGWLEILGAGMVHPIVLQNGGYDPAVFSGFAFGMGIERQAMLKRGVDDIRLFYSNDVRFLERV